LASLAVVYDATLKSISIFYGRLPFSKASPQTARREGWSGMSDDVDPAQATVGFEELSIGMTLERQILMDLLATSLRFGLVVTAVVLAVQAVSPA
jgi:hypothetical protein